MSQFQENYITDGRTDGREFIGPIRLKTGGPILSQATFDSLIHPNISVKTHLSDNYSQEGIMHKGMIMGTLHINFPLKKSRACVETKTMDQVVPTQSGSMTIFNKNYIRKASPFS